MPFKIDKSGFKLSSSRGSMIDRKIERARKQHMATRAAILAMARPQITSPNNVDDVEDGPNTKKRRLNPDETEEAVPEELTQEQSDRLLKKKLRGKRRSRNRPGQESERLKTPFTKLQPLSQKHAIHPDFRRLIEATHAIEHYNEHARVQMNKLEKIKQDLTDNERLREAQPSASKKLKERGITTKHGLLRPRSEPEETPDEQQYWLRPINKAKNQTTSATTTARNKPVLKIVRPPPPRRSMSQPYPLQSPSIQPYSPVVPAPNSAVAPSPTMYSPQMTTSAFPAPAAQMVPKPRPANTSVDRSRDPRLRGRG